MSGKKVRGCPNEQCELHIKKKRQKYETETCPLCGAELIEVCRSCFQPIGDEAVTTGLCLACLEKSVERADRRRAALIHAAERAEDAMVDLAIPVALGAAEVILSKGGKGVVKVGKQIVHSAAKNVVRMMKK